MSLLHPNGLIRLHSPVTNLGFMQTNTEFGYNSKIEGDVVITRVDAALNWCRKNSL